MQNHIRMKDINPMKENSLLIARSTNWFDLNSLSSMSLFLILIVNIYSGLPLKETSLLIVRSTICLIWTHFIQCRFPNTIHEDSIRTPPESKTPLTFTQTISQVFLQIQRWYINSNTIKNSIKIILNYYPRITCTNYKYTCFFSYKDEI